MNRKATTTEEVLELHASIVMKVIWGLTSSMDDARDIFQETFLQHHVAVSNGRVIHNPKAWLCQTARNGAFKLRRLHQRQAVSVADEVIHQHPAHTPNPDNALLLDRIRDLAATLPERQSQVFSMRNFEQLSYAEIADQLGCTKTAARASGYKALKTIRSLMNGRQEGSHV